MQVQPVAFVGSGIVGNAAMLAGSEPFVVVEGPIESATPQGWPGMASYDNLGGGQVAFGNVNVPQQPQRVVGIAYTGFTAVVLYNGSSSSGQVVAVCGGPSTYSWPFELNFQSGLYLLCTGSGAGSVWLV